MEHGETEEKIIQLFMLGVDVVNAVYQNGGTESYLDLLDLFYADGVKRVVSLDEKICNQDFENYVIEVHGLKSAAANIGAHALSALAKQHEVSGNESDFAYIETNKEELFDCYNKVLLEIKRVLQQQEFGQFAKKETEMLPPLEHQEMAEKIQSVLEKVESFHSKEAAQELEELLCHELPENVRTVLAQVQNMLKMYEDDEAEETLHALVDQI